MNKKKILILSCIAIVACAAAIIIIFNFNNKNKAVLSEMDLKTVEDLMIGAEVPRPIYADKEKVIIDCDCMGLFVYDLNKKVVTKSFDFSSLLSEDRTKLGCFVTKDGKHIIFGVTKEDYKGLFACYCYSFEEDLVKKITEKEYDDYRENVVYCTYDYNDELYEKSTGPIVNISDNEYIYVTFQDWKVSTLKIVHVKDGKETYYNVFDKH